MNRKTSAQDCTSKKLFELIRSLFLGHFCIAANLSQKGGYDAKDAKGAWLLKGLKKRIEAIEAGRR
jgi:hypothetical protein